MFFLCPTVNLLIVEKLTEDLVDGVAWLPLVPELPQLLDVTLRTNQSSVLTVSASLKLGITSGSLAPPRSTLEMLLTLGALSLSQRPSLTSLSLISQLKMPGLSFLYSSILFSTSGVATRGLLPPMTPGRILPVS